MRSCTLLGVLTAEELEQIRCSLMMAPTLPADVALRLLDALAELLAERRDGCCQEHHDQHLTHPA